MAKSRALDEVQHTLQRVCIVADGAERVVSRRRWVELARSLLGTLPDEIVKEAIPERIMNELMTHR